MIFHEPITSTDLAIDVFVSNNPSIACKYVATSEVNSSGVVYDIFHVAEPGGVSRYDVEIEKYFGVYRDAEDAPAGAKLDSSEVESLVFVMAPNENGELEYSRFNGDDIFINDDSKIQGGRFNSWHEGSVVSYKIADGEFVLVG
jgi:hypothetical protein